MALPQTALGSIAILLSCALLTAPPLSAEPRERWPGSEVPRGQPGDADAAGPPDLLADLLPGECNGAKIGAIAGATLGGVLGSRIGADDSRTMATVAGSLIGAFIGSRIGQSLDDSDTRCAGSVPPSDEGLISIAGARPA